MEGRHLHLAVSTRDFCSLAALPRIFQFKPDCLHYLTGPTIFSLLALKFHQLTLPGSVATVVTGIRPYLNSLGRALLPLLAPGFYLAQSRRWQQLFAAAGSHTTDLPNSVDTTLFSPVTPKRKRLLKGQWGMPLDRPVVLHVGHVKENRNLDSLIEVQRTGRYQVWIVGSESQSRQGAFRKRLEDVGCIISTRFMPDIERAYQAADAYVFTVKALPEGRFATQYNEVGTIDFPLSILEAMACGLPIVTTRHDAIEYFLSNVPGINFFDGTGPDLLEKLETLPPEPLLTRQAAEFFDIEKVMDQLARFYESIRAERGKP